MRTQQQPQRDVPDSSPGRGLCCPDDPLDLVLRLFPAGTAPPPPSLAALGIGGETPRPEPQSPEPPAESAFGGGWDSWDLSSLLDELCGGLDEIDVDMFFADDALDGGGEETNASLLCDATEAKPGEETNASLLCDATEAKPSWPPAHMEAAGGAHMEAAGSGGPGHNDAYSPNASPSRRFGFGDDASEDMQAGGGAAAFSNDASEDMQAGGGPLPPPVSVTNNNSTPPLPALVMPAVPAPTPPAVPARMPPAAGLHACGASPGIASNGAPAPPPLAVPMSAAPAPIPAAGGLRACDALPGVVSIRAPAPPPPRMTTAPMPPVALHPNAAAWAGIYSISNAPPSATPRSSPPSLASSGSGRCPSSSPTSEPEFLHPRHAWVAVPRKHRSPPAFTRRKRPWVLDFPLHALPPVVVALPPPANPGAGCDGNDAKNRCAAVPVALAPPPPGITGGDDSATGGGSGGIRRRRPTPRQRNRQAQRVCSHCHSPETPQWRAGPDGPGTLCNACGIRYAANRLLPEYRPSTAPSFRSGQHSNRHRKVMRLREQQMKAAVIQEKPSSEQQQPMMMEDDRTEMEKDDGFMGVLVNTYQQQACDSQ